MARGDFPSSKQDQFVLRLPDGMRDRLKETAEANGRSLNSEIIARIRRVISPNADGWVRVWLPQDLIERIEATASANRSTPEYMIREAIEGAFPYVPKLRDYVRGLRESIEGGGQEADASLRSLVEDLEQRIEESPELGERRIETPPRGWEMGPEE